MKKIAKKFALAVAACAFASMSAFSATYNQASQAWVNKKLQELDEKLTSQMQNINYSVLTITNVVEYTNAVKQTINNMNNTAAASFSGIDFTPRLNASPSSPVSQYYVVFGLSDAFEVYVSDYSPTFTNKFNVGTTIKKVGDGAFQNKDGSVAITNGFRSSAMYVNYSTNRPPLVLISENGSDFFVYDEDHNNKVKALKFGDDEQQ